MRIYFFILGKIQLPTDIPRNNTSASSSREKLPKAMEDKSDSSLPQDSDFLTDTVQPEENAFQASDWGPVTGNFATFELPYNLGIPGELKNEMAGKNELSFFEMFVSEDVINMIVTQTNLYAEQQILSGIVNETITKDSRLNSWKETNYSEIRTFIAFLIWMGLDSKPSLPDYWRRIPLYKSDISNYMPRNRFELLLRMFHLANNDECPENDRLHKVQSLVDKMNRKFSSLYGSRVICLH